MALGKVRFIRGDARIRRADGREEALQVGDIVNVGDIVRLLSAGGLVVIEDEAGLFRVPRLGEPLTQASMDVLPNASSDPRLIDRLGLSTGEIERVIQGLSGGNGNSNGDGGGDGSTSPSAGESGVTGDWKGVGRLVERIGETVTPLQFAFSTSRSGPTPEILGVGFESGSGSPLDDPTSFPSAPQLPGDTPLSVSRFTDNFVNGVTYRTSSGITGLTGDSGLPGSFSYHAGDSITFTIGDVIIGIFSSGVIQNGLLFLQDMAGTGLNDSNSSYVENMAVFLQALDDDLQDSTPGNGVLDTSDVQNSAASYSTNINISQAVRDAFTGYVDSVTGVPLNIATSGKEDISRALAAVDILFTRDSERDPSGNGENIFETVAMQHVADTIQDLAGERAPASADPRQIDVLDVPGAPIHYNYNELAGEIAFSANDLLVGAAALQVNAYDLVVKNVQLSAAYASIGTIENRGNGNYAILLNPGVDQYDLEGLSVDYRVEDWTAFRDVTSSTLDTYRAHLSALIPDVPEDAGFNQFTLKSTLTFDTDSTLTINFTSELLSASIGYPVSEYGDDYFLPIQYSNDGGVTWINMQQNGIVINELGVPRPTFGFVLAAGSDSVDIRIPIFDDYEIEDLVEYFDAIVTGDRVYKEPIKFGIIDNDTAPPLLPQLAIDFVSATEGDGNAIFTVTMSQPSAVTVTVDYVIAGLGAVAGSDFIPVGGTLTFIPGQTSATISVPIIDDLVIEASPDPEVAVVTLSNAVNAVINDAQGTLRIFDNDGTNNQPVAVDESITATEDTAFNSVVSLIANDTDVDGPGLTAVAGSFTTTQGGTLVLATDGSYSYTPATNFTGTDTVDYTVTDGSLTDTGTLTITVTAVNDAPVAVDASASGNEDATISITITGSDAEGPIQSFSLSSLPANGLLYLDAGLTQLALTGVDYAATADARTFYFVPLADWYGSTAFTYTAKDGTNTVSGAATGTVTVNAVDDGTPLALNDAYAVNVGTSLVISPASLLANDFLPDRATLTLVGTPTAGTLTLQTDGNYLYTPAGAGTATFTYTITDDEGQISTATVTINANLASTDYATVQESALAGGTGGGTTTATGNVLNNDTGNTAITSINGITDGATADTDARTGYIGVTTSLGELVMDITGAGAGDYVYTLNTPASNTTTANNASFVDSFTYVGNANTAQLQVTIEDDAPIVYDANVEVPSTVIPSYSLVLVLDISGSMDAPYGAVKQVDEFGNVTATTRYDIAKEALIGLVTEYFNQSPDVEVKLIQFSASATILNGGSAYTTLASAIAGINSISAPIGGTNYEDALNDVQTAFGVTPPSGREKFLYFLSDGVPSVGNSTDPVGATGYATYASTNDIKSYAVGIGTGIATPDFLNDIHNVDALSDGNVDTALFVPDLSELESQLLSTVPQGVGGNVVAGSAAANTSFGADDGNVVSVTVQLDNNSDLDGIANNPNTLVTFTFDPAANSGAGGITNNSGGFAGGAVVGTTITIDDSRGFAYGSVVFDFTTGDFSYFTGGAAVEGTSFTLTAVVTDGDGDTATSVQTVTVVDGQPMARDDTDTLSAFDRFVEGNVIDGAGTDGGLALGNNVVPFSVQGAGVDKIVDDAKVASVVFKGDTYDLTTASSGSADGGTYTVTAGTLTWTHLTDGSQLIFGEAGYYKYTPPTIDIPGNGAPNLSSINFTANTSPNGVYLYGLNTAGTVVTASFSAGGAGVIGGNNALQAGETLVIDYAAPVSGPLSIAVNAGSSNLSTANTLTYRVYDTSNNLITAFTSGSEGTVTIPGYFTDVDRVEIFANAGVSASIQSSTFTSPVDYVGFTSAASWNDRGITLSGKFAGGTAGTLTYETAGTVGVGVNNNWLSNGETLVVDYDAPVSGGLVFHVNPESNVSTANPLTYRVYDTSNTLLATYSIATEGNVTLPGYFTNVDRVEIQAAAGGGTARISGAGFVSPIDYVSLTAAPGVTGPVITGRLSGGGTTAVSYSAAAGVGVAGGGSNALNNLETLVIDYAYPTTGNFVVRVDTASNLSTANTLTYRLYDSSNNLLTTYTSGSEGYVLIPGTYADVDRLEVQANTGASAYIRTVGYELLGNTIVNLDAPPAATTGVIVEGMSASSSVPDVAVVYTGGSGVGVVNDANDDIRNLESLVLTFSQSVYAQGVRNLAITVNAADSNLGPPGNGADPALTYKIYDVSGRLLSQFASDDEGLVLMPQGLNNIGKVVIEAAGDAQAVIQSVRFSPAGNDPYEPAVAPEVVIYTLEDSDGDVSTATLTLNTVTNTYFGSPSDDNITGSAANDRIVGGDGNDTLTGGAGYDALEGGAGNDALNGGADNDVLAGGDGSDVLNGDDGDDILRGNAGDDSINGGPGDDRLEGGDGNDSLSGGIGADTLLGGAGNDILDGGAADGVSDVFRWELADRGTQGAPAADTIGLNGFDDAAAGSGGDVLDLRDLLQGETHPDAGPGTGNLTRFLSFELSGGDTVVHVSSTGGFSGGYALAKEDQTITLTGVDLVTGYANDQAIIQRLLDDQKLITD